MGIPNSCLSCQFEHCCDSAMGLSGCHYANFIIIKTPLTVRLKKLLVKIFR